MDKQPIGIMDRQTGREAAVNHASAGTYFLRARYPARTEAGCPTQSRQSPAVPTISDIGRRESQYTRYCVADTLTPTDTPGVLVED